MLLSLKTLVVYSLTTIPITFESIGSKEIGRYLETLVFRPVLEIGLTFANLKALGNLFKDIERLQISVTG